MDTPVINMMLIFVMFIISIFFLILSTPFFIRFLKEEIEIRLKKSATVLTNSDTQMKQDSKTQRIMDNYQDYIDELTVKIVTFFITSAIFLLIGLWILKNFLSAMLWGTIYFTFLCILKDAITGLIVSSYMAWRKTK